MSNQEKTDLLNKEEAQLSKMRKSVIRKCITRKYNTAKYETMDITVDHQHEIEWDSIENLRKKSNNVTTLVTQDFEDTQKRVFEELKTLNYSATMNVAEPARRGLSLEEKKDFDKLG